MTNIQHLIQEDIFSIVFADTALDEAQSLYDILVIDYGSVGIDDFFIKDNPELMNALRPGTLNQSSLR